MNFNIPSSGLSAAQKNIDVVSNNIANETTKGYRTQTLQTEEGISVLKTGGYEGTGVTTGKVLQEVDEIIYKNMLSQVGDKYFSEVSAKYGKSLENLFQDNNSVGLMNDMEGFFSSAIDLKNNMDASSLEALFVDKLNIFAKNLNIVNSNIEAFRTEIISDTKNEIMELNSDIKELYEVTKKLAGSPDKPDLLDKKALLEQSIASCIDSKFITDENGYHLQIGNHRILDKSGYRELSFDDLNNKIILADNNVDITDELMKGSIGAKAQLSISENNEISRTMLKVDIMAQEFIENVNLIFNDRAFEEAKSIEFSTPNWFDIPILDLPEAKGIKPGNVTFKLHTDPLQEFTVNINHETTFESIKTDINSKSSGDIKFSSSDFPYFAVYGNEFPIQIVDEGNTNFTKVLQFNNILEGVDSATIKVDNEIIKNPDSLLINNDRLQNNVNYDLVDKIADLQFKEVDFTKTLEHTNYYYGELFNPAGTKVNGLEKGSFYSFYESITVQVSRNVYNNETRSEIQDAIYQSTLKQYESDVSVDKDEELLKLMKFQAAYTANAKVITMLDEMMDSILRM